MGTHRYDLRFHFAPGTTVTVRDGTPPFVDAGRARLVTLGPGAWHLTEEHLSRCYGSRELAPVATRTARGKGPQEFVTFVLPCAE
jgi:hypothetical protein